MAQQACSSSGRDGLELLKFPRTPHLDNLGSATRDDLVLTTEEALALLAGSVVIEEKVDGANLGISFDNHGSPRCQKRGHWVTAQSEQQFNKLEAWLATYSKALAKVLGTRYILYGEWLAARHSVPYDALPDWFLAFDVYDREAGKFLCSRRRDELLRPTGLRSVPAVVPAPGRAFTGLGAVAEVRQLVLGLRSALCVPSSTQWAEGVYVRREEGGWMVARAKLVHPEFRQAIEGGGGAGGGTHWSKRVTQWNRLRPDLWPSLDIEVEEEEATGGSVQQPAAPGIATTPGAATPLVGTEQNAAVPGAGAGATARAGGAETARALAGRMAGSGAQAAATALPGLSWEPESDSDASASCLKLCAGGAYIALVGPAVDAVAACALGSGKRTGAGVPPGHAANRVARDGFHHHITLVTPPEMEELVVQYGMDPADVYERVVSEVGNPGGAWMPLGLGRAVCSETGSEARFLPVAWPAGRLARAVLGMTREQDFHITLGFSRSDVHNRPKGLGTLLGGRLDEQLLRDLVTAVEAAGLHARRYHSAAVLVLQALTELQTAPASIEQQQGALSPSAIECLRGLLSTALDWTVPPATDAAAPQLSNAVTPVGTSPTTATTSAAVADMPAEAYPAVPAGRNAEAREDADAGRIRRYFVAGCAHTALARLAGRCGELADVDYHTQQAATLACEATAAAVELGKGAPAAAGRGPRGHPPQSSSTPGAALPPGALDVLAAAAACLEGKARSQQGELAAAAGAFERASAALSRMGLPDASILVSGRAHPLCMLMRAVEPSMDVTALRQAAAACARKLAKQQKHHEQQEQQTRQERQEEGRDWEQERETAQLTPGGRGLGEGCGWMGAHGDGGVGAAHAYMYPSGWGLNADSDTALDPRQRAVVRGIVLSDGSAERHGDGGGSGASGSVGHHATDVTLPRNTSWLVPGVLMGSSTPKRQEQIAALAALGVGLVVTLTEEEPLPPAWFETPHALRAPPSAHLFRTSPEITSGHAGSASNSSSGNSSGKNSEETSGPSTDGTDPEGCVYATVQNLFVPVQNYEPPTVEQMDQILAEIEGHMATAAVAAAATVREARGASGVAGGDCSAGASRQVAAPPGVLVHCGGGKGRAGTVLACYLCKYGQAAPPPLQPPPPPLATAAASGSATDAANLEGANTARMRGAGGIVRPAMSADAAVRLVRALRPGSIETEQQRRFVGRYCDVLWRRYDQAEAAAATAAAAAAATAAATAAKAEATAAVPPSSPNAKATAGCEYHGSAPGALPEARHTQTHHDPQGSDGADGAGTSRPPAHDDPQRHARDASHPRLREDVQQQKQEEAARGPRRQEPVPEPPPPPPQEQQQQRQASSRGRGSGSQQRARPPPPPAGLPRLVMLVGLPGSGKSTFARALEASGVWSRICQDECGSRGAAEAAFGAAMLRGPAAGWRAHVVLDRCSPDAADRKAWLELGLVGRRDRGIVAVFFDVSPATCKARVAARTDHPTIPYGRGGRIVDSFAARLQPPTTAEGFERVHVIREAADAEALLAAWGARGLYRVDEATAGNPTAPAE